MICEIKEILSSGIENTWENRTDNYLKMWLNYEEVNEIKDKCERKFIKIMWKVIEFPCEL